MPSINVPVGPSGPVVDVFVGVSAPRSKALQDAGQPVPGIVNARMLIDTGASSTNICSSVIQRLSLVPTGQAMVLTPSTGTAAVTMDQYDVNLYFPYPQASTPPHVIRTIPIICADFTAQGIHGLIGRDILARSNMFYNGDLQLCTLNF